MVIIRNYGANSCAHLEKRRHIGDNLVAVSTYLFWNLLKMQFQLVATLQSQSVLYGACSCHYSFPMQDEREEEPVIPTHGLPDILNRRECGVSRRERKIPNPQ